MSAPFPFLLAAMACTEWLITLRPLRSITNYFAAKAAGALAADESDDSLRPEKLLEATRDLGAPFTYRNALQNALANPAQRPDLIPQRIHLARLEHQYELLSEHSALAQQRVAFLAQQEGGCDYKGMFEAEKYANRVQQQITRLLNNMQKSRKELEKTLAAPPAAAVPANSPSTAPDKQSVDPITAADQTNPSDMPAAEVLGAGVLGAEVIAAQAESAPSNLPISPPPTEEEFLQCIVKNRGRIRGAPAKDREKLMVRLIEEHRAKSSNRAA